jgi:hypothetical protein
MTWSVKKMVEREKDNGRDRNRTSDFIATGRIKYRGRKTE